MGRLLKKLIAAGAILVLVASVLTVTASSDRSYDEGPIDLPSNRASQVQFPTNGEDQIFLGADFCSWAGEIEQGILIPCSIYKENEEVIYWVLLKPVKHQKLHVEVWLEDSGGRNIPDSLARCEMHIGDIHGTSVADCIGRIRLQPGTPSLLYLAGVVKSIPEGKTKTRSFRMQVIATLPPAK